MTAYGALISLQNTIRHIACSPRISLVSPSLEILQLAYKNLQPLQEILERLDSTRKSKSRKKVNALDERIKETLWQFEDKLESLLLDLIVSQYGICGDLFEIRRKMSMKRILNEQVQDLQASSSRSTRVGSERDVLLFSIDLQRLKDEVYSFMQKLKDMEKEYIYEVDNMPEDEDEDEAISSMDETNSKMIGLWDQLQQFKSHLMRVFLEDGYSHVSALIGMAGVGKTTLAKQIFHDPEMLSYFECRAWVTVGRKHHLGQISRAIVAQLCRDGSWVTWRYFKQCLIVLDDVWEAEVLDSLLSSISYIRNGYIKVLVTTRDREVVTNMTSEKFNCHIKLVRFLNEEESKELLCEKVFGDEICPPQLDKAATKIAKKCEGLPLTIVTVGDILSKSENRDPDYWDDVAEERNSVFTDAYNDISKVLLPSYDYLPQYLKMPFLYMGVFPRGYDTPPSKIIYMFTTEGWFLHTNTKESFEKSVWKCLDELCMDKNLVLFKETSIFRNASKIFNPKYKTCCLHSLWRHVCRGEAKKNKFYQVLKRLVDGLEEGVKGQRGLCLENNMLFGIKEFCNSVRLNCASSTRYVLFYGPYHQYPTPIDVGFRLLREVDALQLRFYTFPTEILALIQLKYLALTCNGELPTTISKLFNLQILIIHPHMNIRCCRAPQYVPMQIWDMQELEHIEILGMSLVDPHHVASLENLSTLVGVNASICTISEFSRRIPYIRKLGVQIELMPNDDHNDLLSFFGCISTLTFLGTLKFSIINPVIKYDYVVPAAPSSLMLPGLLKKLHLSGMGFPWEYMNVIGPNLPFLQVLKLRSYAFRGSEWKAQQDCFLSLQFLLIEDTDLECLNLKSGRLFMLRYLSMKHCYKLKGIHLEPSGKRKIELVNCNPLALISAKQLRPGPLGRLHITASSSFDKKLVTIKVLRCWSYTTGANSSSTDSDGLADWEMDDTIDLGDREEDDDEGIKYNVNDVEEESSSSERNI